MIKTRSKATLAEKPPIVTIINKTKSDEITLAQNVEKDASAILSQEEKLFDEFVPVIPTTEKKSLNQSLASKSSGSKFIDEVEDYMEITELTNFDDITFDPTQMTAIIDKEENITFTQDSSNTSHEKFSIVATASVKNEMLLTESDDLCTFKIEYPHSDTSLNTSEDNGELKQFACRHCGKQYRWKSTLRRHENVECGGKAPSYECPYCDYKAKQRGNLGVHVRKHHSNMPQLATKRKRNR